jgi:uncharacterized protein
MTYRGFVKTFVSTANLKVILITGMLGLSLSCTASEGGSPSAVNEQESLRQSKPEPHKHQRPLAVVKQMYEKLGKGDLPGIMATFDKDAKWVLYGPSQIPFAGTHEGIAAIQGFFESFGKNAKVEKFETLNFITENNQVVVMGYEEATAVPTGKKWKAHWAHVFTVKHGKIILVEEIVETAALLAAFQP